MKNKVRSIYKNREEFIVLGLTGKTGSGCSTVADILKNGYKEYNPVDCTLANIQSRKAEIIKKFASKNFIDDDKKFKIIKPSTILIMLFLFDNKIIIEKIASLFESLDKTEENLKKEIIELKEIKKIAEILNKDTEIFKEFFKFIDLIDRENKGLPYSLNEGISKAKGEYIARMDADDISLPERFEKQLEYMKINCLDICGTFMEMFNTNSEDKQKLEHPTKDEDIRFTLLFFSCLAHPTVMLKKEVFQKVKYDIDCKQAQDYQLWVDCAKEDFVFGNIPDVLLNYRIHDGQVTIAKAKSQLDTAHRIMRNYSNYLGEQQRALVEKIIDSKNKANKKDFKYILDETYKISVEQKVSEKTLHSVFKILYNNASPKNPMIYFTYRQATKNYEKDFKEEFVLFLKSLIFVNRESGLYQGLKKIKNMMKI